MVFPILPCIPSRLALEILLRKFNGLNITMCLAQQVEVFIAENVSEAIEENQHTVIGMHLPGKFLTYLESLHKSTAINA